MEVILLEKIRNLGALGDRVKVKRGYGRNFLIPQSKAVYATNDNIVKFEKRRNELEKNAKEQYEHALKRQHDIQALSMLTITAKAGEEGKLFGSIGTRDIANAFTKAGITIEKREIRLPAGALRVTGEHEIAIELHSDITALVKIQVMSEGAAVN